jgi:hypothetical protein
VSPDLQLLHSSPDAISDNGNQSSAPSINLRVFRFFPSTMSPPIPYRLFHYILALSLALLSELLHPSNGVPFYMSSIEFDMLMGRSFLCELFGVHKGSVNFNDFSGVDVAVMLLQSSTVGKSYMFGDNKSVITSGTIPHSSLNKRHNALAYHRVREAIASDIIWFFHIDGKLNPADVLTKFLPHATFWPLIKPWLFWRGEPAVNT